MTSRDSTTPRAKPSKWSNIESLGSHDGQPLSPALSFHDSTHRRSSTPSVDIAATTWLSVRLDSRSPIATNDAAMSPSPR